MRACAQTGRRVDAEKFPGADLVAKINAPTIARRGGRRDRRLLGRTVRTQVVISPGHTLRFASGHTPPRSAARLPLRTYFLRCGRGAVLLESTFPDDQRRIGPSGSIFTIVQDHAGSTLNGTVSRNITVEGCTFRGARKDFNSAYQTVSMGNCQNCRIEGNRLENTRTIGIQLGGGSMAGNYAMNSVMARNEFVGVASQNAAITNCVGCRVENNRFINPGQVNGPGVTVIDLEPNVGDAWTNPHQK